MPRPPGHCRPRPLTPRLAVAPQLTGAGTAAPADVALELELEPQPVRTPEPVSALLAANKRRASGGQAQEEVPPARRERTLSRSIMKPQPEAEAGGAAEPPAETEAALRPRTKSVVWKDATPPKKAPKGTPRAELSTVVTFPRDPGTNARKLVRRAPGVFVSVRTFLELNFG